MIPVVALIGGLGLLAIAADQFVIGAARIAVIRRVTPLVVGAEGVALMALYAALVPLLA